MSKFPRSFFYLSLLVLPLSLPSVSFCEENAVHAKCQINVRLIKAVHGNVNKKSKKKAAEQAALSSDENQQLEALPFGSYKTVDMKSADTSSFTPVSFELAAGDPKNTEHFTVSVTPHSLADNKVHYTLEWSTPAEKSVVATRLGVENGRSVMIGAALSSELGSKDLRKKKTKDGRCFIIGVKVTCHG